MKTSILRLCLSAILFSLWISSCVLVPPVQLQDPSPEFSVDQKPVGTITEGNSLGLGAGTGSLILLDPLPEGLEDLLRMKWQSPPGSMLAEGQVHFAEGDHEFARWYFVPAAAFPTLTDDIQLADLQRLWTGDASQSLWSVIYVQADDRDALTYILGQPDERTVQSISAAEALQFAWQHEQALFILPFEQINPRWKVLTVDGVSLFSRSSAARSYPLALSYDITPALSPEQAAALQLPLTNYDPEQMTTVLMTGVTALVRATAAKMEQEGMTFPASSIMDILLDADLTHVSNEVSFAKDCPPADAYQASVMFCSRPEYFDLLTAADVDVIELSGNHLMDWSVDAFLYSLDLYQQADMAVYAGGINQAAARQPLRVEINGNKLAFLGCNPAGPPNVWATETLPGVANCDEDWMVAEVEALAAEGYMPIVTMQHFETYAMEPNPYQKADFLNLSAHGAVIVSGSQAHLPQGMAFVGDHFIHYGLGNLFFDQMDIPVVGTRREFLDRHVFYQGKYIQTELITAMLEDYARPRLMTMDERSAFLRDTFTASGWMKEKEE